MPGYVFLVKVLKIGLEALSIWVKKKPWKSYSSVSALKIFEGRFPKHCSLDSRTTARVRESPWGKAGGWHGRLQGPACRDTGHLHRTLNKLSKDSWGGEWETVGLLRALTALTENWGLVPSSQTPVTISRDLTPPSSFQGLMQVYDTLRFSKVA